MDALLARLRALYPLSDACLASITELMRREELPARRALLAPGQVANRIYFVESGLARGYYLHEGREANTWFMREGDFLISIVSFLTRTVSQEFMELLEDSVLYSVSYEQLQQLYRDFPEFNYVGRLLTEHYYVLSEQRTQQLRLLRAEQRYEQLVRAFPEVLQRVPLKHLASYLGVTPETISRIRAQAGRR
ncbi:Crp/Fnr family transcriptional regulator [Hymenobacter sp. 15J16-1T3B]|uniref:Crp/Fnr family transcriptional regulator n=1 Tax=Hymenobacter sp. 15J16-1T3B TaxID=2886941 RepID=UPI001D0FB587|nr:Crp/Fnr family transcriptional regulator [Hymenobacter sp. 15J16-1T3B]MCC3159075.1 Crp/Fnr family transcriptional regulator [Hymenobacter sp. 15J16-1T3B]